MFKKIKNWYLNSHPEQQAPQNQLHRSESKQSVASSTSFFSTSSNQETTNPNTTEPMTNGNATKLNLQIKNARPSGTDSERKVSNSSETSWNSATNSRVTSSPTLLTQLATQKQQNLTPHQEITTIADLPDEITPLIQRNAGLINPKVDSTLNINCSNWLFFCCIAKETKVNSDHINTFSPN